MQISARGILATIAASAGKNRNFSKGGTVFVTLFAAEPEIMGTMAK
jgi:hypothetical protein